MAAPDPAADRPEARTSVIVMLDSIHRPGGGESLAIENAIRLDPEHFERSLCLTRWDDHFESEEPARSLLARLRDSDVRVIGLRRSSRLAIWSWLPLLRILRRERIEVLHAHLFGSNVWAALLGRIARVPVIVAHEHMWAYSGSRARSLIDRFVIAPLSSAFIAVSRDGERQMIETERIPSRDIVYLPNGAASRGTGDGRSIRSELGLSDEAVIIGSIGHLRPEKAYEVLIEATALLDSQSDLHVVVAGEGTEREMLERLRDRLRLKERVHLIGARSDIADLLDAFDIAVCCSDFEGGPLSVMEYMEAGLPIVASRVGGLPEMIEDGGTGILVEPRDPGRLAQAISGLLADPRQAAALGSAARELWLRDFDITVWIGRLEALYTRLLSTARGNPTAKR